MWASAVYEVLGPVSDWMSKGLIYASPHGTIDYFVPHFVEYLNLRLKSHPFYHP
jgi:hypothetical protein